MKHFWVTCVECSDCWVAGFLSDFGMLVAVDKFGESCTDCGGEVEIQEEYEQGAEKEYEREVDFDF